MTEFDPNPPRRNFYGRRHGKTLRQSQKGYLSEDLGSLRPRGITVQDNPERAPVVPSSIFGDDRPVWLEVGFGGGEHMVHMAARYPEIGIEVILSDAYMDLVDQGLDVVIRGAGTLEDSTLRAKPLCEVQRVLCAAPDYLKEAGQPAHPTDLKGHNCLRYSLSSSPNKWFFTRDAESVAVELPPASFCANNGIALKQAAVQGLGVILVPDEFVSNELADGTLVKLLPDWQPDPHALFAVYPFHKEQSRNVRLFIEFLVKAFQPR